MKEIIKKIKELNTRRYLYLAMSLSLSILVYILTIQAFELERQYNYQLEKYNALETKINAILEIKIQELPEVLNFDSRLYYGYKTPPIILSGVHFEECRRKTICGRGASGELSPFQIRPLYWKSEKFCRDLDPNNFIDSIECADRVLYKNYLTHNQDWRWTLEFYNGGNGEKPTAKKYANRVLTFE